MADGMCFDKYIDNPSGGAVFVNRNIYKNMYKEKFEKVLVREQGQIKYHIFKTDNATDTFYIYFKIPSEVIENFYYDVVIKLFTTENVKKNNANLRAYAVQFFSNDPAFVYTHAYAFKTKGLFIEEFANKMSRKALITPATTRNPENTVWYVKSLFFAYLAMEKFGLFQRSMLNQRAVKYKKSEIISKIMPAEQKISQRQHAQEKLDAEKRKEKEDLRRQRQNPFAKNLVKQTKTSKVSKVSTVSKVSKITPKTKKK